MSDVKNVRISQRSKAFVNRRIRTLAVSVALAVALTTVGATAAQAAPQMKKPVSAAVGDYQDYLSALAVTDPAVATTLKQFNKLPKKKQERFVAVVTSADPLSAPEMETVTSASPAVEESGSAVGEGMMGTMAVLSRTVTWSHNNVLFGVTLGTWKQSLNYRAETTGNIVTATNWCSGTYTGYAGFWSTSASNSHWVSGSRGVCVTDFNMSLVYKGSAVTNTKRMKLTVDAWRLVSGSLGNV